jgi:hypothetical protein
MTADLYISYIILMLLFFLRWRKREGPWLGGKKWMMKKKKSVEVY